MSNSDFYDFGTDNDRLEPGLNEEGLIQWFSLRDCEDADGKEGFTVGWHIQEGRWDYLDKLCAKAGLPQVKIEQGKINTYWQLGGSGGESFFILARGMYTEIEMGMIGKGRGFNGVRAGVAAGWEDDKDGKHIKVIKARVFPARFLSLFDKDIPPRPAVLVAKKGFANDLLPILGRDGHYRALKANDQGYLEKHGKKTVTPYAGLSVLLVPGKKIKRMNQEGDKGSPVSPIVSDIPEKIGADYITTHHAGKHWEIINNELKDSGHSVEWSKQMSADIYAGRGDADVIEGSSSNSDESPYDLSDHPFDEGPSVGPDGEYATEPVEFREPGQGKPAAKPQPSNSVKSVNDADLSQIPGTANLGQRRMLLKLGKTELAQRSGLSFDEAKKVLSSASKR